MANDKKADKNAGDISEEALREELGREEARQKKADSRLVDDMVENKNLSGSSTFETLAEEDSASSDKSGKRDQPGRGTQR